MLFYMFLSFEYIEGHFLYNYVWCRSNSCCQKYVVHSFFAGLCFHFLVTYHMNQILVNIFSSLKPLIFFLSFSHFAHYARAAHVHSLKNNLIGKVSLLQSFSVVEKTFLLSFTFGI